MAAADNKHASRSAATRRKFIRAAQKLYAERGIDAVSLNEVTASAGQKNRNALQYHFGNKDGLIQAILDSHADRVAQLRQDYMDKIEDEQYAAPEAAARALVLPVDQYISESPEAVYYVKILSQLAATNNSVTNPNASSKLSFRSVPRLAALMNEAMEHLTPEEARQRLFLVVSITFHGIADICRAFDGTSVESRRQRDDMLDQVAGAISALLSAPSRS